MTFHRGTLEEFNIWHDAIKISKDISEEGKIGFVNGVAAPENQRTVAYSMLILHPANENDYAWAYGDYPGEKASLSRQEVKTLGWFEEEI